MTTRAIVIGGILGVGVVAIWWMWSTGKFDCSKKANSFTPGTFEKVPELTPAQNTPNTEAAYHSASLEDFAPALGADENQGGEEVLNLQ